MIYMSNTNFFWFRRDLRLEDNAGLYHALRNGQPVQCIFIFDRNILDELENKADARVTFIFDALKNLDEELKSHGARLHVYYGKPLQIWKELISNNNINTVYTNRDYEPYALDRDQKVEKILKKADIKFKTFKDHVIFESNEVLKADGDPYTVFTPYKRRWLERVDSKVESGLSFYYKSYPTLEYADNFKQIKKTVWVKLKDMGFERTDIDFPDEEVPQKIIKQYDKQRNFPGIDGTSRLGVHFRFGTISIREKARKAAKLNETYLSELVWRDFYSQILHHFPHVVTNAFREKYERLEFRNDDKEWKAWCEGKTGYPIVDAGMRELNETGYMHNRVRMVTASFLTKHLLIDWRWGEAYFAEKLLDFDLASNNGGWQWASGSGTDAAPYFRIFNPTSQMTKFDKDLVYIKRWVPEYETEDYPEPIVDHKVARERCLEMYKRCLP